MPSIKLHPGAGNVNVVTHPGIGLNWNVQSHQNPIFFFEGFEDTSFASRGWYDQTGMTIDTTQAVGPSSKASLMVHWTQGASVPTYGGGAGRHLFPSSSTLYVSYYVKYSTNYVGSGQAFQPHEFNVLSNLDGIFDGPADNFMTMYIEQNYQSGGIPRLAMQDSKNINTGASLFRTGNGTISGSDSVASTETRSAAGANGGVENGLFWEAFSSAGTTTGFYNDKRLDAPGEAVSFQPNPGPGYKNNWNHVEVYFQLNTITNGVGNHDGIWQYWFNGASIMNRSDILFRTGAHPTIGFNQFLIAPDMSNGSPVDQIMWVDNLTVAPSIPIIIP